jgi:hypothetical protein
MIEGLIGLTVFIGQPGDASNEKVSTSANVRSSDT